MSIGKAKFDEFNGTSPTSPDAMDRMNCPSADILLSYHRAKLSHRKRKAVIGHISQCKTCAHKSKYIRNILKDENQLIQEINALIPRNKKCLKIDRRFPFISPKLFTHRYVTAMAIILLIFIPLILIFTPTHHPPTMKRNLSKIENFKMVYGLTQSTPLFLKWNGVPDSRYYFSEIIDSSNDMRWRNPNIESFSLFSSSAFSTRWNKENDRIIIYARSDSRNGESTHPEFTLKK